jgi:hypothetical protein
MKLKWQVMVNRIEAGKSLGNPFARKSEKEKGLKPAGGRADGHNVAIGHIALN